MARLVAALAALCLLLQGCGGSPHASFRATDITGADFARDFSLRDPDGKTRTLAEFKGKVVVVFFGYTHCPDACPTTLAEIRTALRTLGAAGEQVQVVLVTVDPERDTPAALRQYTGAFGPRFLGLTGTPEQVAAAAREFKIVVQKNPGTAPDSYTVDHTAGSYVFDRQGRVRLFVGYGAGAEVFAHDLGELLKG